MERVRQLYREAEQLIARLKDTFGAEQAQLIHEAVDLRRQAREREARIRDGRPGDDGAA